MRELELMLVQNMLNKEEGVKLGAAWLPACELLKRGKDRTTDPVKKTGKHTRVLYNIRSVVIYATQKLGLHILKKANTYCAS